MIFRNRFWRKWGRVNFRRVGYELQTQAMYLLPFLRRCT